MVLVTKICFKLCNNHLVDIFGFLLPAIYSVNNEYPHVSLMIIGVTSWKETISKNDADSPPI